MLAVGHFRCIAGLLAIGLFGCIAGLRAVLVVITLRQLRPVFFHELQNGIQGVLADDPLLHQDLEIIAGLAVALRRGHGILRCCRAVAAAGLGCFCSGCCCGDAAQSQDKCQYRDHSQSVFHNKFLLIEF